MNSRPLGWVQATWAHFGSWLISGSWWKIQIFSDLHEETATVTLEEVYRKKIQETAHVLHQVDTTQQPTYGTEGPSQLFQAVFSKCVGVGQADPPLFPLRLLPSFPFKHSVTRKVLSCLQGCPLGKPEVEGKASEWIRNGTNCSAGVAGQEYTSHTFLRLQVWNQPLSNETKMLGNSLRSAFFSRCELVQFRSTCSYTHVSLGDHLEMVNKVLYHSNFSVSRNAFQYTTPLCTAITFTAQKNKPAGTNSHDALGRSCSCG